jgi:hypothetical protein
MRSAIFITDGMTQIVLTPETSIDRMALDTIEKKSKCETFRGAAYDCQGGWTRFTIDSGAGFSAYRDNEPSDKSLILRFTPSLADPDPA